MSRLKGKTKAIVVVLVIASMVIGLFAFIFPYASARWNFGLQSRETNVVTVQGKTTATHFEGEPYPSGKRALLNLTGVATYPKAMVGRAEIRLFLFFSNLEPNMTEFRLTGIDTYFTGQNRSDIFAFGTWDNDFGPFDELSRGSEKGHIAPFFASVSMNLYTQGLGLAFLQLADQIETFPIVFLNAYGTLNETLFNTGISLNITESSTIIYNFINVSIFELFYIGTYLSAVAIVIIIFILAARDKSKASDAIRTKNKEEKPEIPSKLACNRKYERGISG